LQGKTNGDARKIIVKEFSFYLDVFGDVSVCSRAETRMDTDLFRQNDLPKHLNDNVLKNLFTAGNVCIHAQLAF